MSRMGRALPPGATKRQQLGAIYRYSRLGLLGLSSSEILWLCVYRELQIIFTLEIILKMVAYGIYWSEYGYVHLADYIPRGCFLRLVVILVCCSYMRDPWNRFDALVVTLSWLGLPFGNHLRGLRAFRALRPLRVIIR